MTKTRQTHLDTYRTRRNRQDELAAGRAHLTDDELKDRRRARLTAKLEEATDRAATYQRRLDQGTGNAFTAGDLAIAHRDIATETRLLATMADGQPRFYTATTTQDTP